MSVTTTHDELIDEAAELLKKAAVKLHQAASPDCWGIEDRTDYWVSSVIDCSLAARNLAKREGV